MKPLVDFLPAVFVLDAVSSYKEGKNPKEFFFDVRDVPLKQIQ